MQNLYEENFKTLPKGLRDDNTLKLGSRIWVQVVYLGDNPSREQGVEREVCVGGSEMGWDEANNGC